MTIEMGPGAGFSDRAKARIEKVIERVKDRLSASEIAMFREEMEKVEREEQERAGGA